MSDGARIDYIRRHNLDISNEQVLPYYETSELKIRDLLRSLRKDLRDPRAKFLCIFLLDDFCGSGRTVLREVAATPLVLASDEPTIDAAWFSKLRFDGETRELEMLYEGESSLPDSLRQAIENMGSDPVYSASAALLDAAIRNRATRLRGALWKISTSDLPEALDDSAVVCFCPLLTTDHAASRLDALIPRLGGALSRASIVML